MDGTAYISGAEAGPQRNKKDIADTEGKEATLPPAPSSDRSISAEAAEQLITGKRIGQRIKALRQRKHMGLVELGRCTGLSASFLSQLETGRVVPTLRNLARIATVFSRDLSFFFEPDRPELFRILRREDRTRLPQSGVAEPDYFFESLGHVPAGQMAAPLIAEFLPAAAGRSPRTHQHSGTEFLYIVSGQLRLTQQQRVEILSRGDAAYFDAGATHSYQALGEETCTAFIITMPESLSRESAEASTAAPPAPSAKNETARTVLRKSA